MNLKQSDWIILAFFLAGALAWALGQLPRPAPLTIRIWQPPTIKVTGPLNPTDLNTATYDELVASPGIGREQEEQE
jgi:hypothetical protein